MSMKRYFAALLSLFLLLSLVACQTGDKSDKTSENISTSETSDEVLKESPAEDFEYSENDDGGITITKYCGADVVVSVPAQINGKSVTKIDNMCFSQNESISAVVLPDTVIEIGGGAFFYCTNLKTISLSSNLEIIGNGAFEHTSVSDIVFPQSLKSIGMRAFFECVNLKHVTINKNVNYGEEAFAFSGLETVVLEDGVETLANSMFAYTGIQKIVFPQSLKHVGSAAFCECENLESVTLNEGLVTIEAYAFAETKITEITIPESVAKLVDNAFMRCLQLQKVMFEGNAPNNGYISGVSDMPEYTIYYHEGAEGFTSPEWNGYPTANW